MKPSGIEPATFRLVRHRLPQITNYSEFNPLTPNNTYRGCTPPLTSKRCILYIYSTNTGSEYFKHDIYSPFFFSSKCSLFHNSNVFGSCFIHILYMGCAKIWKKNNSGAKRLIRNVCYWPATRLKAGLSYNSLERNKEYGRTDGRPTWRPVFKPRTFRMRQDVFTRWRSGHYRRQFRYGLRQIMDSDGCSFHYLLINCKDLHAAHWWSGPDRTGPATVQLPGVIRYSAAVCRHSTNIDTKAQRLCAPVRTFAADFTGQIAPEIFTVWFKTGCMFNDSVQLLYR